jgi:TonB family protein
MTERIVLNLGAWSVQAGLLAVAAAILARLVPVDSPSARYAWWRAVLVGCLLLPAVQPWQSPSPLAGDEAIVADAVTAPTPAGSTAPNSTVASSPNTAKLANMNGRLVIVGVLLAGVLMRAAWLCAGLVRLRRIRRTGICATASADDVLQPLIETAAEIRYVANLRQPVTFGIRRPVVLLPATLTTMAPGVQRAVVAHELWHVKRRDWLWSLGEEALRAVCWFHPAIWYLVSRVQSSREEVVDELAVLSTNARRSYLEALLAFADEPAVYPAAPFIRRRQLFDRMMLISREGVMSPRRIVSSIAAMGTALVLAGWYGTLAFPLTEAAGPAETGSLAQGSQMPRDPRPGTPRPATSREQELAAAAKADPSQTATWLQLAKLQEERGAIDDAEGSLRSALAASSDQRQVLGALARLLTRNGQFEKAVATLEDLAAQNPLDPAGHQLVATYYWEKAQKDTSLTPAEKLMYIDSGIRATDRALANRADYVEALTYKNILLRMKANLETDAARREQFLAEANALRTRAIELSKQQPAGRVGSDPSAPPPPPPPPPPQFYEVDGQQAVRIGGNVPAPKKLFDVRPEYPAEVKAQGISGIVIVEAVIDTQGTVRSTRVLRSIPGLDEAALAAVREWRFTPTTVDGVVVPVVMTVTVNFTLQ